MFLKPSEIFFSQDSINNVFDKRCAHSYEPIGKTLDALCEGRCSVSNIPRITVVERDGKWVTADNRRLWVFREMERLGKCDKIPVYEGHYIPSAKLTSYNGGKSVHVRGSPGGFWHNKPDARKPSALNVSVRSNNTNTENISPNTNMSKENKTYGFISPSPPSTTRTHRPITITNSSVSNSSIDCIVQNSGRSLRTPSASTSGSFSIREKTAAVPYSGLMKPATRKPIQPASPAVRAIDHSGPGYTSQASDQLFTETRNNSIRTQRTISTPSSRQDSYSSSMYRVRDTNSYTPRTTSSSHKEVDQGCCIIL